MSRLPEQRERDEALAHGLVIRPPVYRLDARAFVCSQLLDVNRDGLDEDVTVVADGNFLGVVAGVVTSLQLMKHVYPGHK